ncbi:polysaccharide biosynthesis tyrosine autokinase [Chthonobacter rhizosphaerae]|uniref:polysaccharide biosynthesis tyrosine autokinase n=1 Tax=Chthonobacter rhizosphaerae TaxID=2735553 RepID=UPI0015EE6711|nr:polysaccharide biosynthesis tyrosine autokinase [Chthonobacter rhizosphaerae]
MPSQTHGSSGPSGTSRAYGHSAEPLDELTVDLDQFVAAAGRQMPVIVAGGIAGLLLGLVFIFGSQPLYTATTQLLVDDQQIRFAESETGVDMRYDTAKIDSQVELLKAERIALSVIDRLDLANDPRFLGIEESIIDRAIEPLFDWIDLKGSLGIEPPSVSDVEMEKRRAALKIIETNLQVSRSGATYVINISYTSSDPRQAARISNGFGDAYLLDQLDARFDAARRAGDWMQSRLQDLRQKSLDSDLAVQRFRAEHDLIASKGTLLGDQQLTDMNAQVAAARADTAKAEAKVRRIEEIVSSGQLDAAVSEALSNPVIADLRSKYLDAAKRYADISRTLGPEHVQAVKLKSDMAGFQTVIFDELGRIAQSYRSEYEIAKTRQASVEASFASMVGANAGTNETLVTLRELEREAESYRTLYESLLQRHQQTVQQQSFPVGEARVITVAMPPSEPSFPRKPLILALSLVLGGMAGVVAGAIRELGDRGLRTGDQVRGVLGLEFLGLLPLQPRRSVETAPNGGADRFIRTSSAVMRQTLDAPLSAFAETLRAAKIAADLMLVEKPVKVIGVISTFPGEGKSTVSKNLASLLANLGARTLLIDCDLRNPGLTRSVAADAETGLLDMLVDGKPLEACLLVERETGLAVLPAVVRERVSHTGELLASPAMQALLASAGERSEYIIVDLPPVAPVIDVRAITDRIDAFLVVVEWGRTPRQAVRDIFVQDERLRRKCLGVVLNKVDMQVQRKYEQFRGDGYLYSGRSAYYAERS